jgi:putative N6-adenine-specific DNA methylase
MEKLFAVSSPGLEPFTATELDRLGLLSNNVASSPPSLESGGVEFFGNEQAIYQANLHLRTASRVLVRLGDFHAAAFSELRRYAQRLTWHRFIHPGQNVDVRVTCHKSRLYHSSAVAREVIKAINATLSKPVVTIKSNEDQTGELPQLIVVRLMNDHCTISIDSSGHLLHRRGYRLATAKAPLRETLAAGLLFASGWDSVSPMMDPFCGSGTIAIEAAMFALQIPPGKSRKFAFMDWPGFQPELWSATLNPSELEPRGSRTEVKFNASDRDEGAIQIAISNAQRAGVAQYIDFSSRSVSDIQPEGKGWLITNPPYGIRINQNKDLRNLYAQFGNILRSKCQGWNFSIMCNDMTLLRQLQLPLDAQLSLVNGGIPVRVARGSVPE